MRDIRLRTVLTLVIVAGLFVLSGCMSGQVQWGEPAADLTEAGDRVVAVAPEVGRTAGTIVGGAVGGPAGATVGGDLGEWLTKGALGLLGIGGFVDGQRQRKRRGQAEADKREAEVQNREAQARQREIEAITAAKAA